MQVQNVFNITHQSTDKHEYLLSDLEDCLLSLRPVRTSAIVSNVIEQLSLVGSFFPSDLEKQFYSIRLNKYNDDYWIKCECLISQFWKEFLIEAFEYSYSNSDDVSGFLERKRHVAHKNVLDENEADIVSFLTMRDACLLYFQKPKYPSKFHIDEANGVSYLHIEFYADQKSTSAYYYSDKYKKRHLRLNKTEEEVKKVLKGDSGQNIIKHKSLILNAFEGNALFKQKCLRSSKVVLVLLDAYFVEVLREVESIHFQGGFPHSFPSSFWEMINLKNVYINGSRFRELPGKLASFEVLSYLSISDAELERVSPDIGALKKLQELWLHQNNLAKFPMELGDLSNLEKLCLDNNLIQEIPAFISNLGKITWLRITDCRLKSIASFVEGLDNLEYLNLRRNNIKRIPVGLLNNKSLKRVEIAYNPLDIKYLRKLKKLRDEINPSMQIDVFDEDFFKISM